MKSSIDADLAAARGMSVRVRGLVQGVGFRPTVWRLARDCGLRGEVRNDGAGVLIQAFGPDAELQRFVERLQSEAPPLARIDSIDCVPATGEAGELFRIVASTSDAVHTAIVPDAATCPACMAEVVDGEARRHAYPFTNCTHCGPRFSIMRAIPYDRRNTSMAAFELCAECRAEYDDPADRRFHAQPIACPACGPHVRLEHATGAAGDRIPESNACSSAWLSETVRLIAAGAIVAVKGLGGFHLACDATNADAVERLRKRKHRDRKPFALMAADLGMIERYCIVSPEERALLATPAAPIVLLERRRDCTLPRALAPGIATLGFMLPYTPLHHLLARALDRPLVMTSGNRSDEPQCTDDAEALQRLQEIADHWLVHEREIVNRIDDSVARVMAGAPRILRRARGLAPAPLSLPRGFAAAPPVLAMGGTLKNAFCLVKDGQAILSPHQGDLDHPLARADYRRNLQRFGVLFEHAPDCIAVDMHPDYVATRVGYEWAERRGVDLVSVQHHHAHIASCLAENGVPLDHPPVLGIALDGLGLGENDELWGGEFLMADYRSFRRVARFRPVALLGGDRAMREPWRNTYAHLQAAMGWAACRELFGALEIVRALSKKPLATLDAMLANGVNAPPASSCGRLFDAVAAALGICRERASYEGEPAIALETLASRAGWDDGSAYPFALIEAQALMTIDPAPMWRALLDDLACGTAHEIIAARFHAGLARVLAALAHELAACHGTATAVLSGGVFQNKTLFERVCAELAARGLQVFTHAQVSPGDGGLALGQAAIAAAQSLH